MQTIGEAGLSVAAVPGLENGGREREDVFVEKTWVLKQEKKKNNVSSGGKVAAAYGWLSTVLRVLSVERNDFLCQAEHDLFNHTYPRCTQANGGWCISFLSAGRTFVLPS